MKTDIEVKDPQYYCINSVMDVVFSNVLQDLNNFQSKIASLFQDLMKEKVYYKDNLEKLCKNLKEASTETEKLKKEIAMLRDDNLNMRSIIYKAIDVFKNLDLSITNKQHTNRLEALKAVFLEYSTQIENSNLTHNAASKEEKDISNKRYELTEEEIQKEIESLKSLNFCSNLFVNDLPSIDKEFLLQRSCSEQTYKNCDGNVNETTEEPKPVQRTKSLGLNYMYPTIGSESVKPVELSVEGNKSPVFKDFNGRKNIGNLNFIEEKNGSSPDSWNSSLVNEKFLERSIISDISSPEKSPSPENKSPGSSRSPQRWIDTSFKIPKFRIPPSNILKKSYRREVEKSSSGMKILTQTFLNVECFKKRVPEKSKNLGDEENENHEGRNKMSDEDMEDIVIEIPSKTGKVLKEINNKKRSGHELEEIPFMTEPDLDETYISSCTIRKHMLEGEIEHQTPLKRHALESSPVKDFPYKDGPVRKKAERMNLPGHACIQCNKYYENALGDIGSEELKKILNKCSRHRQRYSPSLDDTPPDYWKPYLTSSTIISPNS